MHPSLTPFFPTTLPMPPLTPEGREEVVVKVMAKRGVRGRRGLARRTAERMEGYRGRDVEQVVTRAVHAAITRQWGEAEAEGKGEGEETKEGGQPPSSTLSLTAADFTAALTGFVPSNLKSLARRPPRPCTGSTSAGMRR